MDDMKFVVCAECSVQFGMPANLLAARKKDGQSFTCPNGHSLNFGKSLAEQRLEQIKSLTVELDKAKRHIALLEEEQAIVTDAYQEADAELTKYKRMYAGLKGAYARLKNKMRRRDEDNRA